jgi:hypothetical protein
LKSNILKEPKRREDDDEEEEEEEGKLKNSQEQRVQIIFLARG